MTDEDRIIAAWQPVQGPSLPLQASHLAVVISNYNDASYLEECLKAIRAQLDDRMAFLFIDDGSQDNSVELAIEILKDFHNVLIVKNPENQGHIKTYNAAIRAINAPYIYFASSNDRIADNFFENALTVLAQYPTAGLVSGFCSMMTENGEHLDLMRTPIPAMMPCFLSPEEVRDFLLTKGAWIVGASTIYRAEALREIGSFDLRHHSAHDGLASTGISLSHGACFLPRICSNWRVSESGFASSTLVNPKRIENILTSAEEFFSRIKGIETAKVRRQWIDEFLFWHVRACHEIRSPYLDHSFIHRFSGIPMWRLSFLHFPLPGKLWNLLAAAMLAPFKFRHYLKKKIKWMWITDRNLMFYS